MISESQATVYWVNQAGELMLAPDTRMRPFRGWMRVECSTVSEVEQFSRRMALQQYNKMRRETCEEHLRHKKRREEIKANCRLRLASGCISLEDERLTRQTLKSLERKDALFLEMLSREPDLSRTSLKIEQKEQPIGMAQYGDKRRGLLDSEVNPMSRMAEVTV